VQSRTEVDKEISFKDRVSPFVEEIQPSKEIEEMEEVVPFVQSQVQKKKRA
jgi:hypothetical protein